MSCPCCSAGRRRSWDVQRRATRMMRPGLFGRPLLPEDAGRSGDGAHWCQGSCRCPHRWAQLPESRPVSRTCLRTDQPCSSQPRQTLCRTLALSLDCYSHEGTYVKDLGQPNVTRVTCGPAHNVCVEQMLAMTIVGKESAVLLRAGCRSEHRIQLESQGYGMLPFTSFKVHICISDLCNDQLLNNSLPLNIPPEAAANATDVLRCYSCLGLTPESCSGENMDVVLCPPNFPRCAIGMVTAAIDVTHTASLFYRSCQDSSSVRSSTSTRTEPTTTWEMITRTVTAGCSESLCNDGPHELPTPPPAPPHTSLGDWQPEGN